MTDIGPLEDTPVDLRRAEAGLWVSTVAHMLMSNTTVSVNLPEDWPQAVHKLTFYALILMCFAIPLLVTWWFTSAIWDKARWVRITLVVLFVLSMPLRVSALLLGGVASATGLTTVALLILDGYVLFCLFNQTGQAWFGKNPVQTS